MRASKSDSRVNTNGQQLVTQAYTRLVGYRQGSIQSSGVEGALSTEDFPL